MATIVEKSSMADAIARECLGDASLLAGRVFFTVLPFSYGVDTDVYRLEDGSAIVHAEDETGYEFACVCADYDDQDALHEALLQAANFVTADNSADSIFE